MRISPIQAFLKKNEQIVFNNLHGKRQNQKPKIKLGDLARIFDIKNVFSKGDCTNYSYQLYTITKIILDTVPTYKLNKTRKIKPKPVATCKTILRRLQSNY